jgi:hypothetical protein
MADARNDVPAIAAVLCPAYRGIGGRLLCHFYPLPGRKVLGFSDCASRVLSIPWRRTPYRFCGVSLRRRWIGAK